MKKLLLVTALYLSAVCISADAQTVVARYDFEDGTVTSSDSEASSTASAFAAGSGITGFASSTIGDNTATPFTTSSATGDANSSPDGRIFTGSSADQTTQAGAVTNNDYLAFSLTAPTAGVTYNFTTLAFKLAFTSANPAPEGFFVRSDLTGTTDLSIGTITTTRAGDGAFDLFSADLSSIGALQNVATAVEFRIYFYNPDGVTSTTGDRIDKVDLLATVVPEPSTYAMMGLGAALLVGIQRFRRRNS